MGIAYYLSLTVGNILAAFKTFLPAVIMVIIGTQFLFESILSFALNKMKKRKSYYKKPSKFIFISGMIYRLGQNAKGLANICILLTMVFITIAATFSIYNADKQIINSMFPRSNMLEIANKNNKDVLINNPDKIFSAINNMSNKNNIEASDFLFVEYFSNLVKIENNICTIGANYKMSNLFAIASITSIEKINSSLPANLQIEELNSDEIIIVSEAVNLDYSDPFKIAEKEFKLKKINPKLFYAIKDSVYFLKFYLQKVCIIFPNENELLKAKEAFNTMSDGRGFELSQYVFWDSKRDNIEDKEITEIYSKELANFSVNDILDDIFFVYKSKYNARLERKELSGSFLFLGVFLSLLFLLWLILIMYFRQITEGSEDRHRYSIMQKIGMDKSLIKKTSYEQILWLFILPVLIAVIHCIFGAEIFIQLLYGLGVLNQGAFISALIITIAFVSVLYIIFYAITARQYNRSVIGSPLLYRE